MIQEVLPIARKLGERVLESCATNHKPYIVQAVKTLCVSVEDYSSVLASICQDASDSLEQNDVCATSEHVVSFPFIFIELILALNFFLMSKFIIKFHLVTDFFQEDENKSAKQSLEESIQVCCSSCLCFEFYSPVLVLDFIFLI